MPMRLLAIWGNGISLIFEWEHMTSEARFDVYGQKTPHHHYYCGTEDKFVTQNMTL